MKLKWFLFIINILLLVGIVNAGFYYDIKMNYTKGDIKIDSINIIFSRNEMSFSINNSEAYYAQVNGKQIFFNVDNRIIYDSIDQSGNISSGTVVNRSEFMFDIYVPYSGSGKLLEIYNRTGEKIDQRSLIEFSRLYSKAEYDKINSYDLKENVSEEINFENESYPIYESSDETYANKDYTMYLIIGLIIILILMIFYYIFKQNPKKKK